MPRASIKLTASRKKEIIDACSLLYNQKNFNEIKLQDIADATTLSRTSMYSYYKTKEEIFLALLQREYEAWNEDLLSVYNKKEILNKEQFAKTIANTLENRIQLLKLMSMNNFELELKSRYELVVEYKKALGQSMKIIRMYLDKYCTDMSSGEKENFIYIFFPFTFGLYPYTHLNDKAIKAMEEAEVGFHYYSIYELTYNCILNLLEKKS